jgi:predicted molibdopterin-dependent oxidoreductase YjgC
MSQNLHGARRVPRATGSQLTPSESVAFAFENRQFEGQEGEPVAAALIASGVRVFRYMPETNEPRGGFCFIGKCADCMMTVDGRPRVRTCVTPLRAGMKINVERTR